MGCCTLKLEVNTEQAEAHCSALTYVCHVRIDLVKLPSWYEFCLLRKLSGI